MINSTVHSSFFYLEICGKWRSKHNEVMEKSRKWLYKSNILISTTVALRHKVTQAANALAHLISFMSWQIWISQDTRVKQKVISASFAYLNLMRYVESKLNCQNRDYLPLGILLRVFMTIVWYHGEFTDRIFSWSPTWTKTSEFEQSVEVRTDAKSESRIVEGFPSMNISPGRDPYTVIASFLVSRLVSGYYPVLTDAYILPR